ncbi:MAG TPA: serine hydrolase [Longimicrobiaceae bacterium]|nr:serine hydrolase [Longimicrobiaceae bacterium]
MMRPMLVSLLALVAGCVSVQARPNASPARMEGLEAEVRTAIRAAGGDTAEVSVALLDLATGDTLMVDAHRPMHAASTMKVPVMMQLFRMADARALAMDDSVPVRNAFRSIADGGTYTLSPADDGDSTLYLRVGGKATVRELTELMITRSSNLATNLLIELAGPERIARTLAEADAGELKVLRGVEDNAAFRAGLNNSATAYGLMRALEAIARGRAGSPAATRAMLEILERQHFREMIPAGLPPGVRVANKTGNITRIEHDAAIVFPPGRAPYVLVVLTRGFDNPAEAHAVGREVSRLVYAAVGGGGR